jgi:rubrerythrin
MYRLLASFNFGESMTKESKSESISGKQTVSFQCIDAIEVSLFFKKGGLGFYEKAAKNISEPRVKDMFTRLAEEVKRAYPVCWKTKRNWM